MTEPAVAVFIIVSAGMFWLGFFASWVDTKRGYERRSRELEEKKKAYKTTVDGMMQTMDIKSSYADVIPVTVSRMISPIYNGDYSSADGFRLRVAVERQELKHDLANEIWKYAKVKENHDVPGGAELTATVHICPEKEHDRL